jgi:hypothetical protein
MGRDPLFAFVQKMPAGVVEGVDVKGVMLIQADWVPMNFVVLDCGGMEKLPGFQVVGKAGDGLETRPQREKQFKLPV